jgi:hypothetical protein
VASGQEVTPIVRIYTASNFLGADLGRSMTTQARAEGRQRERCSADENKYCEIKSPAVGVSRELLRRDRRRCIGFDADGWTISRPRPPQSCDIQDLTEENPVRPTGRKK